MLRALPVPSAVVQSIAEALQRTDDRADSETQPLSPLALDSSRCPSSILDLGALEPPVDSESDVCLLPSDLLHAGAGLAASPPPPPSTRASGDHPTRTCRFSVSGLTCADCSLLVENKLLATKGVVAADVSCLTLEAVVEYHPTSVSADKLLDIINGTGFTGEILRDQLTTEAQQGGKTNHLHSTVQVFPSAGGMTKLSSEETEVVRQALLAVPGVSLVGEPKSAAVHSLPEVLALPGIPQIPILATGPPYSHSSLSGGALKAMEWEVEYDADQSGPRSLLAAVQELGFPAHILSAVELASRDDGKHSGSQMWRMRVPVGILFSIPMLFLAFIIPAGALGAAVEEALEQELVPGRQGLSIRTLLSLLLTTPIQFYVGSPLFISAYRAARFSRTANIDTLVVISSSVAYFYSLAIILAKLAGTGIADQDFFEAPAILITLIVLGRWLEAISKGKASESVRKLASMQASSAIWIPNWDERTDEVVQPLPGESDAAGAQAFEALTPEQGASGPCSLPSYERKAAITAVSTGELQVACERLSSPSATEFELDVSLVHRGDCIKVVPGSKIPTDGVVLAGSSHADESSLTGESVPVEKRRGDVVYGGTINGQGVLYVQVKKAASENMLASISALVRQAQASKPDAQQFADRMAALFVPFILVLSTVIFFIWLGVALGGHVTLPSDMSALTFSLQFALSTLVVSCPCAIGLAVPTAIMVATGVAAKFGILFKGGPELEMTHRISTIVFDKTGTLTQGKPTVTKAIIRPIKRTAESPLGPSDETAGRRRERADHTPKDEKSPCCGTAASPSVDPSRPVCSSPASVSISPGLSHPILLPPACNAIAPRGALHPSDDGCLAGQVGDRCASAHCSPTDEENQQHASHKVEAHQADEEQKEMHVDAEMETTQAEAEPLSEAEFWMLAGSAELGSEHPIGAAVVAHARNFLQQHSMHNSSLSHVTLQTPTNFLSVPGSGIRCTVGDRSVIIGKLQFLSESSSTSDASSAASQDGCSNKDSCCLPATGPDACSQTTSPRPASCSAAAGRLAPTCGSTRPQQKEACYASKGAPVATAKPSGCQAAEQQPVSQPSSAASTAPSCCASQAAPSSCGGKAGSSSAYLSCDPATPPACSAAKLPTGGTSNSSAAASSNPSTATNKTGCASESSTCGSDPKHCAAGNQATVESAAADQGCGAGSPPVRTPLALPSDILSAAADLEESGHTVVYMSVDGEFAGVIGVSDAPRAESAAVVHALTGMGIDVWMMSGDQPRTAHAVARTLGIPPSRVLGGLLPADKVQRVSDLQQSGKIVAMVGDGVNDSPALAQAHVGIGMASGTDVAMESAQVVLIKSNLQDVLTAIDLSRVTFSRIRLNLAWAMMYNIAGILLAAGTFYAAGRVAVSPAFAGLSELLSSLPVVFFSLLLSTYQPPALAKLPARASP